MELAQAAGKTEQASQLEAPALKFLSLAGERALGLDTAAALSNLERALALAPEGHPERPEALARFGDAALQAGRFTEAAEASEEAVASFRARGEIPAAARAMGTLAMAFSKLGDPRSWTLPAEALALLEPLGPSPELVAALTEVARTDALQFRSEDAVSVADRALGLASELGLHRPGRALGYRGLARTDVGDAEGFGDYREAIELATESIPDAVLGRLKDAVGAKGFSTDPNEIAPHLEEWRGKYHGRSALLLRPATTAEVSAILRICNDTGTALVTQGGNTGLVGGQIPLHGEVLLSTKRF